MLLLVCCSYGSETSPITDLSEICHTMVSDASSPYNLCFLMLFQSLIIEISEFLMVGSQPQYTYVDGDGTVPAESAMVNVKYENCVMNKKKMETFQSMRK